MTLRSSGSTDITSWEDIWKAAAMITGMCPSQGKKGVKTRLGKPEVWKSFFTRNLPDMRGRDKKAALLGGRRPSATRSRGCLVMNPLIVLRRPKTPQVWDGIVPMSSLLVLLSL